MNINDLIISHPIQSVIVIGIGTGVVIASSMIAMHSLVSRLNIINTSEKASGLIRGLLLLLFTTPLFLTLFAVEKIKNDNAIPIEAGAGVLLAAAILFAAATIFAIWFWLYKAELKKN